MILPMLMFVAVVHAYPNGAPSSACTSLMPSHGYSSAKTGAAPFRITLANTTMVAGSMVVVRVSGTGSAKMKGYILQAKNVKTGKPIGSFVKVPTGAKTLDCNSGSKNSVTHSSASQKSSFQFEWKAPVNMTGSVTFSGTMVESFSSYWTNVTSPNVQITKK